jgi:hypothetical protein
MSEAGLEEESAGRWPRAIKRLRSHTAVWATVWVLAALINGAIVVSVRRLDQPSLVTGSVAVLAQLAATVALLMWLGPVPTQGLEAAPATRRWRLALAITVAVVVFFSLGAAGLIVLVPIAITAAAVLAILRPRPTARELGFALALSLLAMVGGLVEWLASGRTSDLGIALAQLPLVVLSLLAGWAIADRVGWVPLGIGSTTFLTSGAARSLRDFGFGFLLAAPWALGNIANGPFEEDSFRAGWQVFAALHPGVAEEAWARVFIIPLLYWLFRRFARARTAIVAAALVGTYWFAFLHAPLNPVVVLLLGSIQVLPMTLLWLRRGLETAIGFHVCVDIVRFLAAYVAFAGIWFR